MQVYSLFACLVLRYTPDGSVDSTSSDRMTGRFAADVNRGGVVTCVVLRQRSTAGRGNNRRVGIHLMTSDIGRVGVDVGVGGISFGGNT